MIHRISPWVSLRHWEVLTLSAKGRTWRLDRSREWPLAAQPRRWLGHRRRTAGHPTGPFGLNLAKDRFGSNSEELRLSVQVRYAADSRKPADRAAFDRHADRSWWRIRCKYWLSLSGDEARETASHGPLSPAGKCLVLLARMFSHQGPQPRFGPDRFGLAGGIAPLHRCKGR